MKKIYGILIAILLVLTACNSSDNKETNSGKQVVYTSIYPISYIAENISGDRLEVRNIIPVGTDPHSWEPTPKDMAELEDADLVLVNGLGMESWLDSLVTTIGKDKIKEVNSNVDLIDLTGEEHDHDHEGHDHGEFDPHIWMSIENMKIVANNIYESIVKLDGDNEEYYLGNYNKLLSNLDELEKDYKDRLSSYKGESIIVPHEAFSYLAKDYALNQVPIEGINSSGEPDLGKMAEIIDIAKNNNINTVFYEFGSSDKIAKTIASEVNGKTLPLYTLETITKEQIESNDDYISIMYMNLENLEKSFGE